MMIACPKVYIVILNWNNYPDTKKCLASIELATYPNLKVIVVDNASSDRSGRQLQAEFPDVRFIFSKKNLGFSRGCNIGLREALLDNELSYALLLNNDSIVTRDFLQDAVNTAEHDKQAGLIGGKVLKSPESKEIWHAGGYIDRWRGQAVTRGFGEIDNGQYDQKCTIGFVSGGLMLIKKEVLINVGLLPEEYFFGVEEWDYSISVLKAGYQLFYVPNFVVYHKGDGSHWNYDPKFVYNYYRNKLIFQEKYLPAGLFTIWKLVFTIYGKYLATRQRQKIIHKYDNGKSIPVKDLEFALKAAIRDHNKNSLSEETMLGFAKELKMRNRS